MKFIDLFKQGEYIDSTIKNPLKEVCKILFGFNDEQLYGFLKDIPDPEWFGLKPISIFEFIEKELFDNIFSKIIGFNFWDHCLRNLKTLDIKQNQEFIRTNVNNSFPILPKIIGVTGLKFNGKDTVANYICNKYGYRRIAFADILKEICAVLFGFTDEQLNGSEKEVKDPNWFNMTPRQILQFVGTELFRDNMSKLNSEFKNDFWLLCCKKKISDILNLDKNALLVISDVRFTNEGDMIKNMDGVVFRVMRNNVNKITDLHASEKFILSLDVFHEFSNNSSINDLYSQIDKFFNKNYT